MNRGERHNGGGSDGDLRDCRIAVVGMACRFPGAKNIYEFWENLTSGRNSISFFSEEELKASRVDEKLIFDSDYVAARGVLEDIYFFDSNFFGLSAYESKMLDPQQRLFLELAWSALEDAGYANPQHASRTGVYAGMSKSTYLESNLRCNKHFLETVDPYQLEMSTSNSFISSRASYLLNLKGPSVSVNTACSTSLVTIISACKDLANHDCDLAIAGGVSIVTPQKSGYLYREGSVFSRDGQCRAFDVGANGIVQGNGAGVVVLKRLSDAIKDRDHIEAVLLGYAINNDGADKVGYAAPSVNGQVACIQDALSMAEVSPDEIAYVEAHGTGTPLGDPIEVAALANTFRAHAPVDSCCAIGSVKTNVGHTDVASGVAGFIKTVLSVKHGVIPPTLHFNQLNPKIKLQRFPFFINTTLCDWPKRNGLRRAAVNSLGMGGTNAHVIIEEPPFFGDKKISREYYFLPLSCKTEKELLTARRRIACFLKDGAQSKGALVSLRDAAYTLQKKRAHFCCRDFIVANSIASAIQGLEKEPTCLIEKRERQNICFLFSGQGRQYPFVGRPLYDNFPVFKACVDDCSEKLFFHIKCDLRDFLFSSAQKKASEKAVWQDARYAQPAVFVIGYALSKLLATFGVRPDVMVGCGVGEYVAAHLAGIFSLDDALRVVAKRGEIFSRFDACSTAVLPSVISAAKHELYKELETVSYSSSQATVISAVSGNKASSREMSCADYWLRHFHHDASFPDMIDESYRLKCCVYLEVSSNGILASLVRLQSANRKQVVSFCTLPRSKDFGSEVGSFYHALGQLWQHGVDVDFDGFWFDEVGRTVSLPTYPFSKVEHVVLPDEPSVPKKNQPERKELAYYKPVWIVDASPPTMKNINDLDVGGLWLLFLDDLGVGAALCDLLVAQHQRVVVVSMGKKYDQYDQNKYTISPWSDADYEQLFESLLSSNLSPRRVVHLFSLSLETEASEQARAETYKNTGFYSLISFSKAFLKSDSQLLDVLVVSNHVKKIWSDDVVVPEKAAILGPCMVMPQEYRLHKVRFVDLGCFDQAVKINAEHLLVEACADISSSTNDSVVGHRDDQRFVQSYQEIFLGDESSGQWSTSGFKEGGVYLITGGLGQLGLNIASMIAKKFLVTFVLLGRSLLPPRDGWEECFRKEMPDAKTVSRIRAIKEIEALGSSVRFFSADIGEPSRCQEVIQKVLEEVGVINGIIHAAGITGSAALSPMSEVSERFSEPQFSAKLHGLENIVSVLEFKKLDFCALFSSLSSFMGGVGYAAYAASNQCLDAFAAQLCVVGGPRVISINWDAWNCGDVSIVEPVVALDHGFRALECIVAQSMGPEVIVSDQGWLWKMRNLHHRALDRVSAVEKIKSQADVARPGESAGQHLSIEARVSNIFKRCLGLEIIDLDGDFYELGGHSLLAVHFMVMLEHEFDLRISLSELNQTRTVRKLAALIDKSKKSVLSPIVDLKVQGNGSPLFLFHPVNGSIACYLGLAKALKYDGPILGVQDVMLNSENSFATFEEMAGFYLSHVRKRQAKGPYLLAGASLGGNLACEVARQLNEQGEDVSFLGLFDSWALFSDQLKDKSHFLRVMRERLADLEKSVDGKSIGLDEFLNLIWHRMELLCNYQPQSINTKIVLYKAADVRPEYQEVDDPFNHWTSYISSIDLELISGDHDSMLESPNVEVLAEKLTKYIESVSLNADMLADEEAIR